MNRDDIIRMARDCGGSVEVNDTIVAFEIKELEAFANLVAAAEREKVAEWMMARAYATGHGDSVEELLEELEWQVREKEREACATVLDEMAAKDKLTNYYTVAALAIRERGAP